MSKDDCLYHYTNVEVLASILKNRTIRFKSLDKMDDLQEKETADVENIGQFCYVSSWTEDEIENIPMWNMYTDMNRGVRISLKKNPFMLYENSMPGTEEILKENNIDKTDVFPQKTLITFSEMISKKFICVPAFMENILYEIQYTKDVEKLYPKIVHKEEKFVSVAIGNVGKYKNLHWKFQKEWRYIIVAMPFPINLSPDEVNEDSSQDVIERIIQGEEKQPFPYYDLKISDEAFSDMKIRMSPRVGEGVRIIIEDLIEKYNTSAILENSKLVGLI